MIKIVNIGKENFHISHATWGISVKFSGKMSYNNIKTLIRQRTGLHPLTRKYGFGETTGRGQIDHSPPPNLFRVKE